MYSHVRNLVSLTLRTTWHEIKRVRIWEAEPKKRRKKKKDRHQKKKDRHHTTRPLGIQANTRPAWEITQIDQGEKEKEDGIIRLPASSGRAVIEGHWRGSDELSLRCNKQNPARKPRCGGRLPRQFICVPRLTFFLAGAFVRETIRC